MSSILSGPPSFPVAWTAEDRTLRPPTRRETIGAIDPFFRPPPNAYVVGDGSKIPTPTEAAFSTILSASYDRDQPFSLVMGTPWGPVMMINGAPATFCDDTPIPNDCREWLIEKLSVA